MAKDLGRPTGERNFTVGTATSADGTRVGYRKYGMGPPIVLVHGGMMASQNFHQLAICLSSNFTVYVPDRRGRGLSGAILGDFGLKQAIEDTQAVLHEAGATVLFGLSAGGIVALQTASIDSSIEKVVSYEPPYSISSIEGSDPGRWLSRYSKEISGGNIPAAMVTAAKGIKASPVFAALPRFLTQWLMSLAIPAEAKQVLEGEVALSDLVLNMKHDAQIVLDSEKAIDLLADIKGKVHILYGSRSPTYLRKLAIEVAIRNPSFTSRRLSGLGHNSPDNGGKPKVVAIAIREFVIGRGRTCKST